MSSIAAFLYAFASAVLFFPIGYQATKLLFDFVEQGHRFPQRYEKDWRRIRSTIFADAIFAPIFIGLVAAALAAASNNRLIVHIASGALVIVAVGLMAHLWRRSHNYSTTVPHVYLSLATAIRILAATEALMLIVFGAIGIWLSLGLMLSFAGWFVVATVGVHRDHAAQMERAHRGFRYRS